MKQIFLPFLAVLAAGLIIAAPQAKAQDQKPEPYKPEDSEPRKVEDRSCPQVALLADAQRSTVFDGKGRDVTNIVYEASLSRPVVSCSHRKGHQINIEAAGVIGVELGLAAESREIDIPYFIAVIDPEQLVVTKEQHTARVKVEPGNRTGALTVESRTIKLMLEEDTRGADLEVLIGLQLSEDQLDYNRAGH